MAESARPKAQTAGILIRLLSASYDLLILFGLGMIAVGIPITVSSELFEARPPQWLQFMLFMAVAYAYFVGFWLKGGATTGMRPWKLRIAMVHSGDPISLQAATTRFLGLMITWLAISMTLLNPFAHSIGDPAFLLAALLPVFSLVCMLFTKRRQTLHDLIAGTAVFRTK